MNKFIIVFLFIIFLLGQMNPLMEYFKSKVTSKRKFENDVLRHFNHLFVAIILLIGCIWLFFTYAEDNPLWLNIIIGALSMLFLTLSLITFTIYINYLRHYQIISLIYNSEQNVMAINGESITRHAIQHVKWHKVGNKKLLIVWSNYEFLEVFLYDGRRFIISSLLLNPKSISKFLRNLPLTYSLSAFPIVKKANRLK